MATAHACVILTVILLSSTSRSAQSLGTTEEQSAGIEEATEEIYGD